jgi:hypothetical protein
VKEELREKVSLREEEEEEKREVEEKDMVSRMSSIYTLCYHRCIKMVVRRQ